MRSRVSRYERELKSEERRALIWLGLLAVVVTFYFWLKDSDPNAAPYINFFCNSPCPHVTLYWIPFLETLIYYWIGYAGCMLLYFSEDFFHKWGRKGRIIRHTARTIGHICISVYPASIILLTVFGAISIFVPTPLQLTYWVLVVYFLLVLALWFFESLTGTRGIVGRLLEPVYLSSKRFGGRVKRLPKKIGNMRLNLRDAHSKTRTEEKKRGLRFFLWLALTLWFTGLFAWSQTILWQSAVLDIMKASSGNQVVMVTAEAIAETLIVSVLF